MSAKIRYYTELESFRAIARAHAAAREYFRAGGMSVNDFLASADRLKAASDSLDLAESSLLEQVEDDWFNRTGDFAEPQSA